MARRRDVPKSARCVIVGGGVGGTATAYHLAQLGYEDVVLLERSQLTSGSTFHSAGLVGQLRSSVTLTKMMMRSVELYRRLADETRRVERRAARELGPVDEHDVVPSELREVVGDARAPHPAADDHAPRGGRKVSRHGRAAS